MKTSELKIYRDCYELVSHLMDYVAKFNKLHKYTLGERIINEGLNLFNYLHVANKNYDNKEKRLNALEEFIDKFEFFMTLIRFCEEKRLLSLKQIAYLATLTSNITKQVNGWKNMTVKQKSELN